MPDVPQAIEAAQPVTGLRPRDVAPAALLCGDPARVDRIARRWTDARVVAAVREFRVVTGRHEGLALTAASTGIGAPGTAVLVEELAKVGVRTFVRVGNSGGLAPSLALGDLVVTTGAVRDDGTSRSYVRPEYPAAADWRVVAALVAAARARGAPWHAGVTWSLDAFYARNAVLAPDGSLASMSFRGYWTRAHEDAIRAMQAAGVLNCEMEAGVLLTLASLFGLRAGCLCVVSDRTPWAGPSALDLDRNMEAAIDVAHAALHSLASEPAEPDRAQRGAAERRSRGREEA
jgi:uridine phosphorylase